MSHLPNIDYFDHEADIGIIGRGKTIEEAFISAAKATFMIMSDSAISEPEKIVTFEFEESDIEMALVIWLNTLINKAQTEKMVFSEFELSRDKLLWKGTARGAYWNKNITRGVEVKGATLTQLSVKPMNDGWQAQCVVDV